VLPGPVEFSVVDPKFTRYLTKAHTVGNSNFKKFAYFSAIFIFLYRLT
jgi:hypothetical protein